MSGVESQWPVHRRLGGALRDSVAVVVRGSPAEAALPAAVVRVVASAASTLAELTDALERFHLERKRAPHSPLPHAGEVGEQSSPGEGTPRHLHPSRSAIALQLDGQFEPPELAALHALGHRLGLAYIADPCRELGAARRGFAGARVPLALSAHRYEKNELAAAMAGAGFQILLIDPAAAGGPAAVRALAILAELCGIEVGLDATGQDATAVLATAALAGTLDACTRPLLVTADVARRIGPAVRLADDDAAPRVARITLRQVSVPMRQLYVSAMYMRRTTERLIVEIETTDGVRGWGETNGTAEVTATCAEMARKLLGRCPLDHLTLRRACAGSITASRNGLRDWSAWAGLEMALFDWRGRRQGMPVRRLLGDAGGENCEAVCHIPALVLDAPVDRRDLPGLFADAGRRRQVVEHTLHQQRESGCTAFKIKSTGTCPEWDVALLRDLRAALGTRVKLRWDPNANYPPAAAAALVQRLEELQLEFYEDPTRGIAGMAQVRAHVNTPLATNMCVISFDHLAHAIRQPCVDVLLADVVMWGGPQSIVDLAGLVPLLGLDLTIHSAFEVGIGTAMNLHLAGALAPIRRAVDFGLENMEMELITPRIPVRNGRVAAPDGPGLGVVPDWDEVARCQTAEIVVAG
ncbi:MAG TPA: mandelate racemase/muconate lactonizing enzyme family protein [Acetobacteraceae bacterium]|nr:mandelate racemase/muconate lactonizing enzyme family protein [Acetobacteraceae bacterium]